MKVRVTEDCTGCGLCVDNAPEVFEMGDDDVAHVKLDAVPEDLADDVKEAAGDCPVEAIIVED